MIWGAAHQILRLWDYEVLLGGTTIVAVPMAIYTIAVWIGIRALLGLYPAYGFDSAERLRRHTYSTFAALAMLTLIAAGFQVGDQLPRLLLIVVFSGLLFTAPFIQHLARWGMRKLGIWGKPVMILTYKDTGEQFWRLLEQEWDQGYDPVSLFDYRLTPAGTPLEEALHEETLVNAMAVARGQGVDTIFFALPRTRREQLTKYVSLASRSFRHVVVIPNLGGITNSAVVARNLAGTFGVEIEYRLLNVWAQRLKRVLDLGMILFGGMLVLPLLLVLSALVWLESGGPVFYKDLRMGRNGKLFPCIKFRTMVPDAETLLRQLLAAAPEARLEYERFHKLREDPRTTRIGHFLRKTSLDELPQLWNVLLGQMSLVGPRPYLPRESEDIGDVQDEILRVTPGITGPWQVAGRNQTSFSGRVQIDAYYVHNWSVWLDIIILARTIKIVLFRHGAY